MRITNQLLKKAKDACKAVGEDEFKYWKKFVYREQARHVYGPDVWRPLSGWETQVDNRVPQQWYHSQFPAYSRMNIAAQTVKKKMPIVQPIKQWEIFLGDRKYTSTMSRQGHPVQEGVLMGIGNSLLDITVVTDEKFLKRFDLKPNDAIIASDKHKEMYHAMLDDFKPSYLPGGATQNSIRVAQWLLGRPKATTFFGCVGNDKFAQILKTTAENVGVNVRYQVVEGFNTGRCGAVITGEDRSLVTELGAAGKFDVSFLNIPDNWELVKQAQFYYIGGFFLPVSIASVKKLVEYAAESNKTVIMNLHATFLCQYFADKDLDLMRYVDVLFGNGDEAKVFSDLMGFNTTDVKEMAAKTVCLPKHNNKRERIVVFTQGRDPTIVASGGKVTEYPVKAVPREEIKDTNGCGDAFVGGFLSQLAQGKSLDECLRVVSMLHVLLSSTLVVTTLQNRTFIRILH